MALAIAAGAIGSGFQHGWATGVVNCPQWFVMTWIRGCNASLDDPPSDALNISATTSDGTVTDTNGQMIKEECVMNKTCVVRGGGNVVMIDNYWLIDEVGTEEEENGDDEDEDRVDEDVTPYSMCYIL